MLRTCEETAMNSRLQQMRTCVRAGTREPSPGNRPRRPGGMRCSRALLGAPNGAFDSQNVRGGTASGPPRRADRVHANAAPRAACLQCRGVAAVDGRPHPARIGTDQQHLRKLGPGAFERPARSQTGGDGDPAHAWPAMPSPWSSSMRLWKRSMPYWTSPRGMRERLARPGAENWPKSSNRSLPARPGLSTRPCNRCGCAMPWSG